MPPFAALPSRGSREFTPPFAALPSRGSRDFMPPFAARPSRRSRELTPPFAALPSRRSREFTPPFADQPALSSLEMTPPSTANPSPPACLWLNARRPASDSMPAGLPLIPARQECRWLKLAGLPLTQARRIAADSCHWSSAGKANSPLSASRRRPRPTSVSRASWRGESQPAVRGSLGLQPAEAPSSPPAPAVVWSSPPAAAIICQASRLWYPQTAAAVLTSQPAVAVFDQTVTTVFLTVCVCLAPEGSWYPWASPRTFWGGVVGLRPKRLRWGLGPRSRKRSHHGLPSSLLRHGLPSSLLRHGLPSSLLRHGLLSSLLHLDLGLSVPLWRPRPVYESVSVLWGLQSAHPPSLVVLLRHGTCLPGGGSYVRDLLCASCGSRLLFLYLVCFLSVVIIVYSCHLLC